MRFSAKFKSASVIPPLKIDHLNKTVPASYRPISNLTFISKILERLLLQPFQPHILASPSFNKRQSAYRPGHSTETTLLLLYLTTYTMQLTVANQPYWYHSTSVRLSTPSNTQSYSRGSSIVSVCMYVCIKIYVRAAAYSLDCHEGAMINCRLYRTFQSLNVSRTETVISRCRELSVVVSSTVLGQSTRNFVVHSSWSCSN